MISQNLFREADAQIIALADPMESVSLEGFYYKGTGGRAPLKALVDHQYAQKTGVATQTGNNGHSSEGIRRTVEYLRDGAIGTIRQAHAPVPAGRWNHGLRGVPEDAPPLPDGFNWDLWPVGSVGLQSWRTTLKILISLSD